MELDIYELGLSQKSIHSLNDNGIFTIGELVKLNHRELEQLPKVGKKIIADIMFCLRKKNLHLGVK